MSTTPVIRQLPAAVANQIAAGEVVERPAAVVKELAENSLDADAQRIVVRIADGGRRLVEVEDDGHGMRPDDLRLALERHATSKLATADDLFRIATLGFRGEALPSIAAVSEFELASRAHDAPSGTGHVLRLTGGAETAFAPCAMAAGTRVTVRNLFWNVPARLKFLKSEASETGHVTDQVIRLALSHPQIAFRLEADERVVVDLPAAGSLEARIRTLFGKDLAASLIALAAHVDGAQIAGFVAHPREAKPTAKRQYCFLNGRFVRDRLLVAAVRDGFKGFLEPRLHGTVFLHLDLDPALVDVNVHPTKSEVRFRREGEIFALVSRALHGALDGNQGGFSLLTPADRVAQGIPAIVSRTVVKPAGPRPSPGAPLPTVAQTVYQERFIPREVAVEKPGIVDSSPVLAPARTRVEEPVAEYDRPEDAQSVRSASSSAAALAAVPRIRRILQLNTMYLLIETDAGIRLVDQHALHEKALFLALDPSSTDVMRGGRQERLIPISVELAAAEVAALARTQAGTGLLADLAAFGIEAEVFGPTTVLIRAHPAVLRRLDWQAFLGDLAASGSSAKAVAEVRKRIAHSAACHGAVKAGQALSAEEQQELVQLLYRLEGMEHCPHGRPTTLDLPWAELARRFQR